MDSDVTFEKILVSLCNLSKAELTELDKQTWELHVETLQLGFQDMNYQAEGKFTTEVNNQETLSFDTIQSAISSLNPAEIQVLNTLIGWHLNKDSHRDGDRTQARISGRSLSSYSEHSGLLRGDFGSSLSIPPTQNTEDMSALMQEMQRFSQLLSQANEAKSTGDIELASQIMDQVLNMARELGMPEYMLETLRKMLL